MERIKNKKLQANLTWPPARSQRARHLTSWTAATSPPASAHSTSARRDRLLPLTAWTHLSSSSPLWKSSAVVDRTNFGRFGVEFVTPSPRFLRLYKPRD